MILFKTNEFTVIQDYSLSHKLLLLRMTTIFDENNFENTDILFGPVFYMEIPTYYFEGLSILAPTEEDVDYVRRRCDGIISGDVSDLITAKEVLVIISNGKKFYIGSHGFEININNLHPDESSIAHMK